MKKASRLTTWNLDGKTLWLIGIYKLYELMTIGICECWHEVNQVGPYLITIRVLKPLQMTL